MDLVNHFYCLPINITKIASLSKKYKKKIKIININDNKIRKE